MGLNSDLGFSKQDRSENIRRVAEVARLFNEAGTIVLSAFIFRLNLTASSPENNRVNNFIEAFVHCPLKVCEKRDVKGLYASSKRFNS